MVGPSDDAAERIFSPIVAPLPPDEPRADTRSRSPDRRAPRGAEVLHDPRLNRGTAFSEDEREALGLRGLLPPRVFTQGEQVRRILANLRRLEERPLDQYLYLVDLLDRNEQLFYRTVIDNLAALLPVLYTPTVGEACRQFGLIFRRPRGLYVSARDRGRVREVLRNWPQRYIAVVVVTDGERILGLGDLGAHGMGIAIGKLMLYTACGGLSPSRGLPVMLDVGTDNETLRAAPQYIGLPQPRLRGQAYLELVDEFMQAVEEVFPGALIQFEDFGTPNAFALLARYRDGARMFNDDIQGTAAVVLAGLLTAGRLTGAPLGAQRVLFVGAGVAVGAADLLTAALTRRGLSEEEARRHSWFFDRDGLLVAARSGLPAYPLPYAHTHPPEPDLLAAIRALRPTALIGLSGQGGLFTERVLRAMGESNQRPIVFAMSNPTSCAECAAEEAYRATDGRVIYASGSPTGPLDWGGQQRVIGQANNASIFPGVGLGVVAARLPRISDTMFLAAAEALARAVLPAELNRGTIYPGIDRLREVAVLVAEAVVGAARQELPGIMSGKELSEAVREQLYQPSYPSLHSGEAGLLGEDDS
jgi:malate dehydrogenase (oxaloacetate-decarboxylating)(NADP+)